MYIQLRVDDLDRAPEEIAKQLKSWARLHAIPADQSRGQVSTSVEEFSRRLCLACMRTMVKDEPIYKCLEKLLEADRHETLGVIGSTNALYEASSALEEVADTAREHAERLYETAEEITDAD